MAIHRMIVAAASALMVISAAHSGELQPIQAQTVELGEMSGVAYYTVERDGFHVVATLAQGEVGTPVRFEAVLLPGQNVVLSTPRLVGVPAVAVEISRHGDELLVAEAPTN